MEIVETTYGSDKAGLVCGYLFTPGCSGCAITTADAETWLLAQRTDEFLWLHFNLASQPAERWLRQHLSLPAAFYESLHEISSTRVELADDTLLAVLNDVRFELFSSETAEASTVCVYVDARMMISARITPLQERWFHYQTEFLRNVNFLRLRLVQERGRELRLALGRRIRG